MVKYLVAIAMLAGLVSLTSAGTGRDITARHFDHGKHTTELKAKGIAEPACAHCHPTSPKNTRATLLDVDKNRDRDHKFCDGGQCHGPMESTSCAVLQSPDSVKHAAIQACIVCHAAPSLCLKGTPPPAPRPAPAFGHGHHVETANGPSGSSGPNIERACLACHDAKEPKVTPPPTAAAPHELCAAKCHGATDKTPMAACESCHQARAAAPPPKTHDPFRIDSFAHATHMLSTPKAACTECHGKRNAAADDATVRATMLPAFDPKNPRAKPELRGTCGSCHDGHDGGKPVSVVGACMKCHAPSGSALPPKETRTDIVFSHAAHETYGVKKNDCASCHSIKADGTIDKFGIERAQQDPANDRPLKMAERAHTACATSGCHASRDFANQQPTICGVCHVAASAWGHTPARTRAPAKQDKYQNINHAAHLKNPNVSCETCHGSKLTVAGKPHDHEDCAPCHGKGQSPVISACASCHSEVVPARPPVSPWSVAAQFDHVKHGRDNRGAVPACVSCHASVPQAQALAAIASPRMIKSGDQQGCDSCHDGVKRVNGVVVFKATGFGCVKCHAKPQVASLQ